MSSAPLTEFVTHIDLDAESEINHEIDDLLDGPATRRDPAVIELQHAHLVADARHAATTLVEVLVHSQLVKPRGVRLTVDDPPVDAHAGAMVVLHQAMCRYRHVTRLQDALEVVHAAIEAEAGSGVAAVVMGLLERLQHELTEAIRAS
jgi:hypothetical protein